MLLRLDLFENDDKGPAGDLDIAVILDGQFVDWRGEAASAPDVLLFAAMDRAPNRLITEQIERLSAARRPHHILVR